MIAASGRFDIAFTCTDSTGAPTAPTGTPTGTLVKNGTDLGTTVTVTMSTAQGVASCTIPSDAANGDRFYLRVSAVVSGTTYVLSGPVETVVNTVSLPSVAPTDWLSGDSVKADAVTKIQSGLATAAQVTALNNLSSLANLFGPTAMEIPDSGSTVYKFTLTVKDQEGKSVALDASPTITVLNPAGTSRAAGLSAVSNPATGEYTFTYTVSTSDTAEALTFKAAGTVSAEARSAFWVSTVVDYDALLTMAAIEQLAIDIKERTDNLPDSPAAVGSAMTLTSAYDAAKYAASQSSVDAIATNAAAAALWSKRGAAVLVGTISTAGTSLEVYTLDGVTVTATVDSSGNRSSVVFS